MQASTSDPAEAFNLSGGRKRAQGDLDGALADYTKAIELKPDFAVAYSNRSLVRLARKDVTGALADLETAISLSPNVAEAYVNRAEIHKLRGDAAAALDDY